MKILILLLAVAFPVLFAFRNSEQLKELLSTTEHQRHKHNRLWHYYQFGIQILFAVVIALTQETWFFRGMAFAMSAFIFWFLFDLLVNRLNNRPGLYLSDNGIDRIFKRIGEVPVLVLKIFLLMVSITWFFVNPFG